MFEICNIRSGYGYNLVLDNICVEVSDKEIVTIIGANGAGKSTLINTVSGLVKVKSGSMKFNQTLLPIKPHAIAKMGIVQVPEGRKVFSKLSVRDNLIMGSYLIPRDREKRNMDLVYELFPILKEREHQIASTLSGGEQQMLAIGRAIMGEPKLLLLDEPSLGLSPLYINMIFTFLKNYNREWGLSMLLVEQNAKKALSIADRAYVMDNGRITAVGTAAEIASNQDIIAAYLGGNKKIQNS